MKKARWSLRVLRAERRLAQYRLVQRLRLPDGRTMSQTRYSHIENGVGNEPTPQERTAIAAALGVAVSDIDWPTFDRAEAV